MALEVLFFPHSFGLHRKKKEEKGVSDQSEPTLRTCLPGWASSVTQGLGGLVCHVLMLGGALCWWTLPRWIPAPNHCSD